MNDRAGIADLDVATYFGMDRWFRVVPLEYGPLPRFEEREIGADDEFVVSVDYRGITRRNRVVEFVKPRWRRSGGLFPLLVGGRSEGVGSRWPNS